MAMPSEITNRPCPWDGAVRKKYSRHAWHYRTLVLSRHGAEEGFFVGDRFPLKLFRESIEVLRLL